MKKFNFPRSSMSNVNVIFILDCLNTDELQTALHAKNHLDDLIPNYQNIINRVTINNINDWNNFVEKIGLIKGVNPLIQIHGHGNDKTGLQLPSGEFISWNDLMEAFNTITKISNGETTIIMSCCYSYNVVFAFLDKYEKQSQEIFPAPFGFFYGYVSEVSSGTIDDEARLINESIIKDGGKFLIENLSKLKISLFSEYDHIDSILAFIIYIMGQKEPNTLQIENLSLKGFRRSILNKNKTRGIPFDFSRKFFNQLRDNPKPLLQNVIENGMHNTERKTMYMNAIQETSFN